METRVNYTIIGAFVIGLVVALIIIVLWLSTGITKKYYKTYIVYVTESVSGLNKQAAVKFNGVDVGYVDDIQLDLKDPNQVILFLKVDPVVPITTNTTAVITEQGITGIAFVGLQGGIGGSALELRPGEKYPVIK